MSGTLFLDTSALLRRYLVTADRRLVLEAMDAADDWVTTSLARTEVLLALGQLTAGPHHLQRQWTLVGGDWDGFWEIPLDQRALDDAVDIGGRYGLAIVDALPLACAHRLPRPCRYGTFERRQIPAAADLGFDVVAPFGIGGGR